MNFEKLFFLIELYIYVNLSIVVIGVLWFLIRNIRNGNFRRLFKNKYKHRFEMIQENFNEIDDHFTTNDNEILMLEKQIENLKMSHDEMFNHFEKLIKPKRNASRNKK